MSQDSSDEEPEEEEEDFSAVQFGSRYLCQRVLHASACRLATNNSPLRLAQTQQRPIEWALYILDGRSLIISDVDKSGDKISFSFHGILSIV